MIHNDEPKPVFPHSGLLAALALASHPLSHTDLYGYESLLFHPVFKQEAAARDGFDEGPSRESKQIPHVQSG